MTMTYDDILTATGGRILATSPAVGWERCDGSWDTVRDLGKSVLAKLVLTGMAGAELTVEAERVGRVKRGGHERSLKGHPAGPDELAWIITETGMLAAAGTSTWDAGQAVAWYVAAVLAVQAQRTAIELSDEPEPDPLPVWCEDWIARMVCPIKAEYARSAAQSMWWGWIEPASLGRPWEIKVWAKLDNRHRAHLARTGAPVN